MLSVPSRLGVADPPAQLQQRASSSAQRHTRPSPQLLSEAPRETDVAAGCRTERIILKAALGSAASVSVVAARHARRSRRNIIARQAVAIEPVVAPLAPAEVERVPLAAPPGSAPSWREEYWFPVASTVELDPARPTPVRVDGLDLVVWKTPGSKDGEGWQVFADVCPHRLAPLSEGRLEPSTGCLQCAYHGWEYDSAGSCTRIPQVEESEAERVRQSPRAQAIAFPCRIGFGLVWAWLGESAPKGEPEDVLKNTHLDGQAVSYTYTRDLPYGYDALMENFVDVSHIPFAHHGLQGTRDDAVPVSMTVPVVNKKPDEDGHLLAFSFEDRTMGKNRSTSFSLRSPFFFYYDGVFEPSDDKTPAIAENQTMKTDDEGKQRFRLNIACVPVEPGWSRAFIIGSRRADAPPTLFDVLPKWVAHIFSNRFLDSDLAFLHYQERNLRYEPRGVKEWNQGYFMPAESDRSIGAFRQWLKSQGARCVDGGASSKVPASPKSRKQLLDRYSQHTRSCKHCMEALEGINFWTQILIVLGLISLVLDRSGAPLMPLWVSVEVVAVLGVALMQALKQQFYFVDYEHYKT